MTSITTSVGSLDVQSIVSQLMTVEQQPLTASQKRISTYNSQLSDVGKISSALSSLQTAITKLSTGSFLQAYTAATSDATVVTAAISSGGAAGSYALNVTQLAQAKQLVFDKQSDSSDIYDPSAALTGTPSSLTFRVGNNEATVDLSSANSLKAIASQINAANAGVTASIVQSNGKYKLILASTLPGTDSAFDMLSAPGGSTTTTISGLGAPSSESHDALDAELTVNGVSATSGSNHLSDVVSGVDIDISKTGAATITLTKDFSSITSALQSFVDAYNLVKSSTDSARSGSMKGNASVLSVQQQLVSILQTPVAGVDPATSYGYLSQVGISLQKDGTLKLDQAAFNKALAAGASAVTNLFGNSNSTGFGDRLNSIINIMLGPNGMVETSRSSINSRISIENNFQTSLNSRLTALKAQYTQQYTTLNAVLAQMQQSSSNLSGLLASSSSS